MKKIVLSLGLLLIFTAAQAHPQTQRWFKGNTHCHTTNSDGDELPRRVVRWYRDHGYHFIVISDHDFLTDTTFLDTDPNDDFILIPGVEISDSFEKTPIHVNAINVREVITPRRGKNIRETLQNNIDAVVEGGGLAQINHPNWRWAFADEEMTRLKGARLFEVYNYSYNCNNFGAGGKPGMEEIWDRILSRGILMYGVASDDAHDYTGEFNHSRSNPGTGWIMVRSEELTPDAVTAALARGDFYATNGIRLKDLRTSEKGIILEIEQEDDMAYTTSFIGKNGEILKEVFGTEAAYEFRGDELYVRARVFASSGEFACIQPVFPKSR